MGRNIENVLGMDTWRTGVNEAYTSLQRIQLPNGELGAGVSASLNTTLAWTAGGEAFAFGVDTVGQLGLGTGEDDEKMVSQPRRVESKHLEGYEIQSVSIADNHAIFLTASKL